MRNALRWVNKMLGNERAIENARRDADEFMRMLAAVDVLAGRVAARTAAVSRLDRAA